MKQITGTITSAAFALIKFGTNFKNAIETIQFASSNSNELGEIILKFHMIIINQSNNNFPTFKTFNYNMSMVPINLLHNLQVTQKH